MKQSPGGDQTIAKIVDFIFMQNRNGRNKSGTLNCVEVPRHVIYDALYEYVTSGYADVLKEYEVLSDLRDTLETGSALVIDIDSCEVYVRLRLGAYCYYRIEDWFTQEQLEKMDQCLLDTISEGAYTVPHKDDENAE